MDISAKKIGLSISGTDYGQYGIGLYTRELIRAAAAYLQQGKTELHVFGTAHELAAYADVLEPISRFTVAHTLPGVCNQSLLNSLYHKFLLPFLCRKNKIDVFILPSGNRRVFSSKATKTIAVVHDISQHFMGYKYGFLHEAHLEWVVLRTLKHIDLLVAVSEFTAKDLREVFGENQNIQVIHNGCVDRSDDGTESDEDQLRPPLNLKRPYVLYPSRLEHPGKNHLNLINAYALSDLRLDYDLVLTGEDWGAKDDILKLCNELEICDAVHVKGHMEEVAYNSVFQNASAILCVGLREGFGLPAIEGVQHEKPVLVSDTGAMQGYMGSYPIYCDPGDTDSMRIALDELASWIKSPESRASVLEGFPEGYFTWKRCGQQVFIEIERLLKNDNKQ